MAGRRVSLPRRDASCGPRRSGRLWECTAGPGGAEKKEALVEPMSEFAQLHLHFTDPVQWRYEVMRPLVLFEDRTVGQRAEATHLHPDTVRRFTRRFQQQGMLGLFPTPVERGRPSRGRQIPDSVLQEVVSLDSVDERATK